MHHVFLVARAARVDDAVAEVRAELRDVARHDTRVYDLAAVTAWGPDGRPCWGDPRFGTLQAVRDYVGSGTGVRDADPFAAEVGAGRGVHTRGAVLHLASMRVQPAPAGTQPYLVAVSVDA